MQKRILIVLAIAMLPAWLRAQQTVRIVVHANQAAGQFKPVWAYVGHDEPNYTYSREGRALLSQLAKLSPYRFHDRAHNLLISGNGTPALKWGSTGVYSEDAAGRPVYNWTILDRIFDAYKDLGITPYVEIGFMPEALSTHPRPYRHHWPKGPLFTGWAYPPKDYHKWSDLIYNWVRHSVERYGQREVAQWDWEVWNEPGIGYWKGTPEEYYQLYDYTAAAVKRALPQARVGGPATTGPASPRAAQFLRGFLTHCVNGRNYATGKTGSPLDFIAFHAKGRTRLVNGQAQMEIRQSLRDIAAGFALVAGYPKLRHLPIVISESDPEGCAACAARIHPENAYRNTPQYASYQAELIDSTLALAARYHVNLQGSITWAFTFPGQPWFYGYRALATHEVDKPILNAFRMFGLLQRQRVKAESSGQIGLDALLDQSARHQPDIRAIATRGSRSVSVLVWSYDDNGDDAPPVRIRLQIDGLTGGIHHLLVTHYRIDRDHSDAYTTWTAMGSPQHPSTDQIAKLKAAGQLQLLASPTWLEPKSGRLDLPFGLPRQALSLIRVEWQATHGLQPDGRERRRKSHAEIDNQRIHRKSS